MGRPPLGLIPKEFHEQRVKAERFKDVCEAISRYYNAGMKINIKWIEEYNELVESNTANQSVGSIFGLEEASHISEEDLKRLMSKP